MDHNHHPATESHKEPLTSGTVYSCPMHPNVKQAHAGMCPDCGMQLVPVKTKTKNTDEGDAMYSCPMHPEVIQKHAGMCPECGMQLVPVQKKSGQHEAAAHDKHEGHSTNIFKVKFWVSLILSVPVVAYSPIVQDLLEYTAPQFPGSEYLPLILSSIIFFYGGWVFLASAYRELRAKLPGMMTLIALAVTTAYTYSVYIVFTGGEKTLFWELATLITVMLLGHWMEMRAVSGAQSALKELSKLLPDSAEVIRDGKTITIPLEELITGDIALVKPGGKIPADGTIAEGQSDINEAVATGESNPVSKQSGDEVIAGTTNGDGSLQITVTKIGDDTFLAGVMRLVVEAQSSKSRLQMLSDRAAYYLTIIAVVIGGITLASWLAVAEPAFAVERMVAVLVITCPHALGLAIPLVASISTTKAARNGFLVKQRLALEAARNIDVILFDKTGTLTKGEFGIDAIVPLNNHSEEEVLQLAAIVNAHSEHPIAHAIVEEARQQGVELSSIDNFIRLPGKGAQAMVGDRLVVVGSPQLLEDHGVTPPDAFVKSTTELAGQGKTVIYVFVDNVLYGAIALADIIREESREAIQALHAMGIKTAMITGDTNEVAEWVAQELDIDEYFARVLPDKKSEKVKLLQGKGMKVAMVGDGVNDAPALTQADLGIAIGAGTNVALESAGIILVKNDPRDIPKIVRLSQLTYKKMLQNLFWATGYNIIAIPLAAGVLAFQGIFLQPAVAAVLMSLSTVIVSANAVLLRNKSLE